MELINGILLSEEGTEDTPKVYGNVNYNSKGAHIKGLTNGKTYYAYIEYDDGSGNEVRSKTVKLTPDK